ncbi:MULTISPECIES: response regulator transcription factor [Cytobacillus]|uniref:Response regulator transcription factor n=1 Tax=Cytobacillus stercorigallinarum TaxID=2762240 RepID=A0ABR8QLB5_9BACI|nr:response regulator transcription factor [Cytobacillus stercorigallinarum]MBD7936320.1 response regulator transcription factor [Cytobacillus stercorigallinarum]
MKKILVIEDDIALNQGITLSLKQDNYSFTQVYTLEDATAALHKEIFDLMLVDINLPDGNGVEWIQAMMKNDLCPFIFLTANDLEVDIVRGLELGADDYITKPFSLMILRARVSAVFRRQQSQQNTDIYQIGNFYFNFEKMQFMNQSKPIELSKTEQKLLRLLIVNKGQTLQRELLIDKVWLDESAFVEKNALSVAIKRLRDKLGKENRIETVYGIGYSWKK